MKDEKFPEVLYNGKWSPICRYGFWNTDWGATLFCQELGYSNGIRKPGKSMKVFFATKLIFTHNKLYYILKLKNSKPRFDIIKHIDIV